MKRVRAQSMTKMRVNAKDGFCILTLMEGPGKQAEVHLPIPILERAAAEARRGKMSFEARQAVGPLEKRGQWEELSILDLRNAHVAIEPMRDPPAVILALDKDTETQLNYRIPADVAGTIGRQLVDQSEQCKSPHPPTRQ